MAHRSQCSSVGDNPLDPHYLPPHYREDYRLAIDALVEDDLEGYYDFLKSAGVVDFLSRPEIEHIKGTLQFPQSVGSSMLELPYCGDGGDQDGSSDTYWPLHSDLDAPGLDLGWPLPQHSFVGPTEVTTFVNPSDPDMPSIKEQARRLIKTAQQVIAVVMDMFTDVDLFADLLDAAARHVPIYILLDEQNAHHFVAMVASCKVNLEMIHMMRVRTVAGITYFCRTGKSFKGQVMDRFLLADSRAVLSGNYSFMWSFEKIHRCIAHLFLGELVATFDEEFRILFAQSQPLVIENTLVPMPTDNSGGYYSNQYSLKRAQSMRNPRGFRHTELSGYSFGDRVDSTLSFRREDPFRHTIEPGAAAMQVSKFASQQFRTQHSFLDQGRSMIPSRQQEMNAYKRHSYAEGTQESYSSSRQYMKKRVMNNLEESESHFQREQHYHYQGEGPGPGSGYGHYDSLRSRVLQVDQHSDSGFRSELDAPPGGYNVLSSEDLGRYEPGKKHPAGGRYGPPSHKRPTAGQSYACQSSPTQLHPPELKSFPEGKEQDRQCQDSTVKQGLRSWRINSYLSGYEDAGEEGLPQPMGPDAFEEPEPSAPRFSLREPPNVTFKPKLDLRPRYGKPILPERDSGKDFTKDMASTGTVAQLTPASSLTSLTSSIGIEGDRDLDVKEPKEISITKHESFRNRLNPMLQRTSRLRSSLIFSTSKLEMHSSLAPKPSRELHEEEEESDPLRTSSIVAEILEKRKSLSREPFDFHRHKTTDTKAIKELPAEATTKPKEEPAKDTKEEPNKTSKMEPRKAVPEDPPKVKPPAEPPKPEHASSMNMNDPASRLLYFKELAAKRKASKIEAESAVKIPEPELKKPDHSDTPPGTTTLKVPIVSITHAQPAQKTPETSTALMDPAAKPPTVTTKPKPSEPSVGLQRHNSTAKKEENPEAQKKDPTAAKTLKPFPSPKFFKRETLKPFKGSSQSRRISCGEEILTDATDAEKSELKKSRSHSSSSMPRTESRESLNRYGSNSSLNQAGSEGKQDTKAMEFLKKQTQRLKGFLDKKGDKKTAASGLASEEKAMKTVPEISEEQSSIKVKETRSDATANTDNQKAAAPAKPSQSRYQSSTTNVLFSSNLRDDTKVILGQISANSQKNRLELAKQAEEAATAKGADNGDQPSGLERQSSIHYQSKNRFGRSQPSLQERDSLLKRIESMRKEKKVYSRFEVLYRSREECSWEQEEGGGGVGRA